MIREIVADTYSPETYFYRFHPEGSIFTDPDELPDQDDQDVDFSSDGGMYSFDYDLPLNHERSEFTVQFEFYKRRNGLAVVLHDLHVL